MGLLKAPGVPLAGKGIIKPRRAIRNIASVGIIFRQSNPSQIFLEMKDDGHPIKLVRRQLCFIGGNWIGEEARKDRGPLDTFRRELIEEISFERPIRDSVELALLGLADAESFMPAPALRNMVTEDDRTWLQEFKWAACDNCVPFGDFINTVTKAALDAADPENERDTFTGLICYWAVPLNESCWHELGYLQHKFGSLSNESISVVTSLQELVKNRTKTAFGHDRVLQRFFLAYGLKEAGSLSLVDGVESEHVGTTLASYSDYMERYEILRKPV